MVSFAHSAHTIHVSPNLFNQSTMMLAAFKMPESDTKSSTVAITEIKDQLICKKIVASKYICVSTLECSMTASSDHC